MVTVISSVNEILILDKALTPTPLSYNAFSMNAMTTPAKPLNIMIIPGPIFANTLSPL